MPFVHDPSTVIESAGRFYVYTTGRGIPMLTSPDLVHWSRLGSVFAQIPDRVHAEVPNNNGKDVWAPDIVRVGHTFYLYYAVSSWGSFRSVVALATNPTLDPSNPSYHWTDRGVVARSDGVEDMNAIDPGVMLTPAGTLWLCYGSYHGSIRVLQLDPSTGLPLAAASTQTASEVARESEASDMIFHAGYFYLFVNHGSCCQGKNSGYNIRVGRSRAVTGPYLDKHGIPLTEGGGSLFLAAHDHRIGPGHFGRVLYDTDTGEKAADGPIQTFSLHYEADLSNSGRPTLGIRPLLWSADGWPVAGDSLPAGNYQILSQMKENSLGLVVPRSGGATALRVGAYYARENEQWKVEPAGNGLYKLVNLATKAALGADAQPGSGLDWASVFSGADRQLWRLDQFTDGSYRICNKATNQSLTVDDRGNAVASPFVDDEEHHWLIASP
jgi:arabinan endo-1,5-alpha-L-arabinosidase